ncbi:MAG: phosphatase PAP2 family protein, partial [Promethearchaeota archaeon]
MATEESSKGLLNKIEALDHRLFLYFYNSKLLKNKKIINFAKIYSFFGNIYFWGVLWLVWVAYGYITKDYMLLVLFTSGFIQSMIIHIIIRYSIVKRNRPYITLEDKGVIQQDELIRESKSFPSGHVAFVIFFGIVFAYYFEDYFWIIFLFSIGIDFVMAICRLILGVHFPIDVIFGFIFGLLYALLYFGVTCPYWVALF